MKESNLSEVIGALTQIERNVDAASHKAAIKRLESILANKTGGIDTADLNLNERKARASTSKLKGDRDHLGDPLDGEEEEDITNMANLFANELAEMQQDAKFGGSEEEVEILRLCLTRRP